MRLEQREGMWCATCRAPVTAQRRRRGFMEWLGRGEPDPFGPSATWHCPECRSAVRRTTPSDLATGDGPGLEVRLVAGGPRKIEVIKTLRLHLGLDLRSAKELYEAAPTALATLTPELAERLAAALRALGATVETEG